MVSGQAAIWCLSAGLVGTAVVVYHFAGRDNGPIVPNLGLPFWPLAIGFAAAERFAFHVHFRRSAHSMSLGDIPLVFALLFAGGQDAILAGALGRIAVLAFHRRLPPIRLAFNFGQFLLGNGIAVLVAHAVAGPATTVTPLVWGAAVMATASNSVAAVLLISVAVSLSEGALSPRQVMRSLRTDLVVVVANTSIGLCAATVLYLDRKTAVLMTIPIAGMFVAFRAYMTERQRHERLEFLYRAARSLSRAADIGPALEELLAQSLEAFRAEVAEMIFFAASGDDALRTTVRASRPTAVLEAVEPDAASRLRSVIEQRGARACSAVELADGPLAGYLEARELREGMFAVLEGERSCIGAILIGNPSGVVDSFSREDVKLFETLAHNTASALENDRLGHAVWRMKELQHELRHRASHDPLTDLCDRRVFAQRAEEAIGAGGSVSVIFLDIDDFKTVNDSLGHAAGDALLVAVAERLSATVRPDDTVARLGGDEFAILLGGSSTPAEAVEVAGRINAQLAERFTLGSEVISVRASAGIATAYAGDLTPEELLRNADVAMYRAKQRGKNGYELFESGMEVPVLRRHGIKRRLRDAVPERSFEVHYQPIVELGTGRVTACEALVRWLDGPRGCVHPSSFIPIAEEIGTVVPIGRAVLSRACVDAQRWGTDGTVALHVNVSPVELRQPSFVAGVAAVLKHSGLSPQRLVLEVTEGIVLQEPEHAIGTLGALRGLGVQIALDDFGTGYSSLCHLRSLPVDWLKIGTPFLDDIDRGGSDRPFMRMTLDLAGSLELGVVAEGIESAGQMASLRELGCGYGQGFYLGRPVPSDDLDLGPWTESGAACPS